jgi:phosphonate metabolism protein PhnN/1,5-bisphosphokinase (PRPP-forming)
VSGVLVPVVGPSGAGKDSLIAAARSRFSDDPRVSFVRRTITRAEGGNEDHDTVDPAGFAAMRAAGAFVLTWGAHGLYYGIPVSALEAARAGAVVVANLSRGALTDARAVFPAVRIVNVTAPPAVLAARLARRGRESRSDIETRLARPPAPVVVGPDVTTIDNGGSLAAAAEQFVAVLEGLAARLPAGQ